MIYFDHNATTPLADPVRRALISAMEGQFKNPSSSHREGQRARAFFEMAKANLAKLLGALEEELILTSGATESNHLVFNSLWERREKKRTRIITTSIEHDSVLKPLKRLSQRGAEICRVNVDAQGNLDRKGLEALLDENVLLVSLMLVNNETGFILPLKELSSSIRLSGAYFHTDAASAVGKMPLSFRELGVDFMTFSAHKFYGPAGVGGCLWHRGIECEPLLLGGSQEKGRRAGTENLLGLVGMKAGLEYALENLEDEMLRMGELRNRLKKGLMDLDKDVFFHESTQGQQASTLHLGFPKILGRTLLASLDLEGVCASFGSACHSGSMDVSPVILAMGIPEAEAECSIRVSLGKTNTKEEVDEFVKIVGKILDRI